MPRYIDADILIDMATHDGAYGYVDVHDILNIPTADVVERKKGKWIESNDTIIRGTCSCCGWNAITAETDVVGMPFCPNCGADMRNEIDDIPMEYFENGGV